MRVARFLTLAVVTFLTTAALASAEVRLTIRDGRVSLLARDATLRQILAEWTRVGGTKVVNADRVPDAPVTLLFDDVSEEEALGTLLRSLSGYVSVLRESPAMNLSKFDRILIMPTLAPATAPVLNAPPPVSDPPQEPEHQRKFVRPPA